MTREEKLQQFAEQNTKGLYLDRHNLIQMVKQGAAWADSHPQWIPVEEELPKCNIVDCGLATYPVLVYREDGFIDISCYDSEVGEWDCVGVVTHWMQLPQPPRKEE
jgi:hypothetical protein